MADNKKAEKIKFTAKIPGVDEPLEFECSDAVLLAMERDGTGSVSLELWWHQPTGANLVIAIQALADQLEKMPNKQMNLIGQMVNTTVDTGFAQLKSVIEQDGVDIGPLDPTN